MIWKTTEECPNGHILQGMLWDDKHDNPHTAEMAIRAIAKLTKRHPWCGLCHSMDLKMMHRQTPHETMQAAQAEVVDFVAGQMELAAQVTGQRGKN